MSKSSNSPYDTAVFLPSFTNIESYNSYDSFDTNSLVHHPPSDCSLINVVNADLNSTSVSSDVTVCHLVDNHYVSSSMLLLIILIFFLRQSTRVRKPPPYSNSYQCHITHLDSLNA